MEKINISKLSSKYGVRKLTEADIELIYNLCLKNQQYYEYCEKQSSVEQIQQDLKITPPNKSLSDKYYVGFFDEEKLVAVMDLIDGYPKETVAFIGFFMIAKESQGKGIGSLIIEGVCSYLKTINFDSVRLGIDKNNPQSNHFWKKNGFLVIKEIAQEEGIILLAERIL